VTPMPLPVSENLGTPNSPVESARNGITFAMTVAAIVLMGIYFAISVVTISH
jgi:hypothetical protein